MSGVTLSTKEPPIADRLVVADELTVYHGQPTQLSRFIRVVINGVIGRLYFEELTPAEDQAYMVRHYDFVAQKQAADAAMAKAEEAKRKAKAAADVAQQMTAHNLAILAQLQQESDRRSALIQDKAVLTDKLNAVQIAHADTIAKMQAVQLETAQSARAQNDALCSQVASLQECICQQKEAATALANQVASTQCALSNLQAQFAEVTSASRAKDAQIELLQQHLATTEALLAAEQNTKRSLETELEAARMAIVQREVAQPLSDQSVTDDTNSALACSKE